MSILGASKHPVLIKKISLSLWLLRDEVEAIIQKRLELTENDEDKINLDELSKSYSFTLEAQNLAQKNIEETEKEEKDSGEDEMAAALAEASESEEEVGETADTPSEGEIRYIEQRKPILNSEKVINGSSFLAEINIDEMFLFSSKDFLIGQSIVIEFNIPRHFIINATVFYCRAYNMKSRIISHNPLPFRVGVKFSLSKAGERALLREFLQSIEPDLEAYASKQGNSGTADDDDEDDILDGLDDDL